MKTRDRKMKMIIVKDTKQLNYKDDETILLAKEVFISM